MSRFSTQWNSLCNGGLTFPLLPPLPFIHTVPLPWGASADMKVDVWLSAQLLFLLFERVKEIPARWRPDCCWKQDDGNARFYATNTKTRPMTPSRSVMLPYLHSQQNSEEKSFDLFWVIFCVSLFSPSSIYAVESMSNRESSRQDNMHPGETNGVL